MIDCKKLWRIGINRHSVLYPIPQHPSPHQYIHTSPQRTTKLRGRRGGARGGEMAFATMNASPPRKNARSQSVTPKGKSARSQSVPPGKGTPPTAKVRTSDARQCTISSTILSLILSIIPSLVYYKKHTSNLLTLKSESGILWSS